MEQTTGRTPRVTSLGREECVALLASVAIGRLALTINALPAIRCVKFELTADHVVFRVAPTSTLRQAAAGVVAFQADDYDPSGMHGWWVQVIGLCEEVTDPLLLADLRSLPLEPWALGERADNVFRVPLSSVTGVRVLWQDVGRPEARLT